MSHNEKYLFPNFSLAKLLYIEDEKIINSSMTRQLNFFKENKIISTLNCKDGFEIYKNNSFDLIVCDVFTPLMNGIELIKKIREENEDIKIFVVTGFDLNEVKKDLTGFQVDAFFEKPVRVNDVISRIESILKI